MSGGPLALTVAKMSTFSASQQSNRKRKPEIRQVDVGKLFEKLPPHAIEAECALLGSMILDWKVCGDVLQIVAGPDSFYKQAHGVIYTALLDLYNAGQSIDLVQIKQKLADRQALDAVGGTNYLIELAEKVPSAASAPYYATIVQEKSMLRKLIEATGHILDDCYNSDETATTILDTAERSIFQIAQNRKSDDASDLKTLLDETMKQLEQNSGRMITGVATGFFELDEMLSGMQRGEMIIVAARPSMGKTAFALNMAEHIACDQKQAVVVFSLEMGKQQLAQRLLCSRSGVDSHRLRRNILNQDDFLALMQCVDQLSTTPLFIDDTPGLSLLAMRAKARRLAMEHDIKAVFVDYLQLMSAGGRVESRQQEVSEISRSLKALARELNVPVVVLSQLNRQAEGREGHRPRMSDLRESGSIEQDADVVMLLHREDYFKRGQADAEMDNKAEIIVAKQRNGPTGTVELMFDGGTTRFRNLASGRPYGGNGGGAAGGTGGSSGGGASPVEDAF